MAFLGGLPQVLWSNVAGTINVRARKIIVSTNLTLVDNADGTATLTASGGGGGAVATDVIWDAKGDLAAGTGADTAAKVVVGTDGQVLTADSTQTTGLKWSTVSGTGTVTSVSMTVPADMAISGSPITTTGTLGLTRSAQSGNKVLSSPSDGSSGTPTFRALVATDIPTIAESGVTSLTTDLGLKAPLASPTFTGTTTAPEFSASGLTGATAASRYVGATASAAPVSGTFVLGDWIIDQTGKRWTCTVGGSPGTWVQEPGTGGGGSGLYSAFLHYEDRKTAGTAGGTFTSGAWRTRDINTEVTDTGNNGSVASNQITLAAGTYDCWISCSAELVNKHQARLQDITNTATLLVGSNSSADSAVTNGQFGFSVIVGRFVLSGSTVIEIQHQCQTTRSTNGYGEAINGIFTVTREVYTQAYFWKV